jgi:oxygen-independent coproporphyrinogen-3 oxidase
MTTRADDLALYVHVPFCGQRCAYCHFEIKVLHPRTDADAWHAAYVDMLLREAQAWRSELRGRQVTSLFYGGGTPSRLSPNLMRRLHDGLSRCFAFSPAIEVTVEVNPEDVRPGYLEALCDLGVNRLSLGVQSFHDPCLAAIKRPHSGAEARAVLQALPHFPRGVSLDLMLGLPYQDEASLAADLDEVEALAPEHLSLYMLERDLPTPLDKLAARTALPDEDRQAGFYEVVTDRLTALGYRHYEISNFTKPGFRCRHNLVYWRCGDYLGLGPAAHGRIGRRYYANAARLQTYRTRVQAKGRGVAESETWSEERLRQERVIQGLRLDEGVPLDWVGEAERVRLSRLEGAGLFVEQDGKLCLTRKGRLLANEVFMCFLGDEVAL